MPADARRPLAAIVLAAGEGKRFRSSLPKVLHPLGGRPMLAGVLDAVAGLRPADVVLVVGRGADEVRAAAASLSRAPLVFAPQRRQHGTADATRVGLRALSGPAEDVLVVPGDTPLLTTATLRALVARHRRTRAAATILTAEVQDPSGYGRIVRSGAEGVAAIVEHADASAAERAIREVNTGVYVFDRTALTEALRRVRPANRQSEYYLTDAIGILRAEGRRVEAVVAGDADEIMGVNSRAQLADASAILRARTNRALMESGVTIVDPASTYIDATVRVGRDTVLHPNTVLSGGTRIGAGCEIGPSVRVSDSRIGDAAVVSFAVLDGARVGSRASVGPFAYLRPGARLRAGAKVGTYVEVKNSVIGEGSKVPHLSYVGDARIGADVNVGAGTVTVNYDPETRTKAPTVIGDGAKIGSDTMLVAPVTVGRRAVTGAGSVVTRDVPADTVVAGVPARPLRRRKGDRAAQAPAKAKGRKGSS